MTAPFWNPAPMITAMSHSETSKNEKPSTYYSMTEHIKLMNEQKEFYLNLLKEKQKTQVKETMRWTTAWISGSVCMGIFMMLGLFLNSNLIIILAYPLSILVLLLIIIIRAIFDKEYREN